MFGAELLQFWSAALANVLDTYVEGRWSSRWNSTPDEKRRLGVGEYITQ